MNLLEKLSKLWRNTTSPFLIYKQQQFMFNEISFIDPIDISCVKSGDVVAVIGDFNPTSIRLLIDLFDIGSIVVPLTMDTELQHEYFFENALVDFVILTEYKTVTKIKHNSENSLLNELRKKSHAGLCGVVQDGGGWVPLFNQSNSPTVMGIGTLHNVPQGHGGGYPTAFGHHPTVPSMFCWLLEWLIKSLAVG